MCIRDSQYAFLGDLRQGELEIPVEFEGETNYICPADGEGTLQDGELENVVMRAEPITWNIPKDGEYRIVVNMEKKTVKINSPDKPLELSLIHIFWCIIPRNWKKLEYSFRKHYTSFQQRYYL